MNYDTLSHSCVVNMMLAFHPAVEPTIDESAPGGETQKDSAADPVKDMSNPGDDKAQDGLAPASAEDGLASVPGKDEAQNVSMPAETNEEGIPPKDNQANADTSPPQTPPGDIPGGPRDNPDLSRYCGSCRWKATKMSCKFVFLMFVFGIP